MNEDTINGLQNLIRGLHDSISYLHDAADSIQDDELVANTLRVVANNRQEICDAIGGFVTLSDESPKDEGTFLGSLRTVWTSFRAGLNAGDSAVVLIEAERAEDVILSKFKDILPKIAGNPVNNTLLEYYEDVKCGHDQIRGFRDAYQSA